MGFPNHMDRLNLALLDIDGLNNAMQALQCQDETDARIAVGRAMDDRLREAQEAVYDLSLAMAGETTPTGPLSDALDRLRRLEDTGASTKKIKRAEKALIAAPCEGPWDTLHKLYALTAPPTVTKDIRRHVFFEVLAALRSVDALPS